MFIHEIYYELLTEIFVINCRSNVYFGLKAQSEPAYHMPAPFNFFQEGHLPL